jgi:hypothetical protein
MIQAICQEVHQNKEVGLKIYNTNKNMVKLLFLKKEIQNIGKSY